MHQTRAESQCDRQCRVERRQSQFLPADGEQQQRNDQCRDERAKRFGHQPAKGRMQIDSGKRKIAEQHTIQIQVNVAGV